jgi:hypothetical protein
MSFFRQVPPINALQHEPLRLPLRIDLEKKLSDLELELHNIKAKKVFLEKKLADLEMELHNIKAQKVIFRSNR